MKKSFIVVLCYLLAIICFAYFLLITPLSNTLEASTINQVNDVKKLEKTMTQLSTQIDTLHADLNSSKASLNQCEQYLDKMEAVLIDYYIDKLSDSTYIHTYNGSYIYYTAAENLGQIGKAAIPKLIKQLDTSDDYTRTLVLYALLLASQDDTVKAFAGNDYIKVNLDFDVKSHPQAIETARIWWDKYQSYF
ncbi:MAG: hypothetical protein E7231_11920 [Cellulosilyticum sp.]|nr:hypothetical protein [Cellulosilyticum sp.]